MKHESVWFNGVEYRRYPESSCEASRKYYVAIGPQRKYLRRLHQEVYKFYHGPIPPGYQIHHKDHNPLNNDPSNLEAIDKDQHLKHHGDAMRGKPASSWQKKHLNLSARPAAIKWHKSPEGRAWHKEHAKRVLHQRTFPRTCEYCGASYRSQRVVNSRFCTPKCQSAWRRSSGIDNITRICEWCKAPFIINKNLKNKLCSRKCVAFSREAKRKTLPQT